MIRKKGIKTKMHQVSPLVQSQFGRRLERVSYNELKNDNQSSYKLVPDINFTMKLIDDTLPDNETDVVSFFQ